MHIYFDSEPVLPDALCNQLYRLIWEDQDQDRRDYFGWLRIRISEDDLELYYKPCNRDD